MGVSLSTHPFKRVRESTAGAFAQKFLGAVEKMLPGASVIAMLVGVLYPSIESYRALGTESKDDDSQWLAYWIIFSLYYFVEYFLEIIFAFVPLYYEAKLAFVLWLALPQTRGALKLWNMFKPQIDQFYGVCVLQLNKIHKDALDQAKAVVAQIPAAPKPQDSAKGAPA